MPGEADDPRVALRLAARSCWFLCGFFIAAAGIYLLGLYRYGRLWRIRHDLVMPLLVLSAPATIYGLIAWNLQRRKQWAIIIGLVAAVIQAILFVGVLLLGLAYLSGSCMLVVFGGLGLAASVQLIQHLVRARIAINLESGKRGFEVLQATPVVPLPDEGEEKQ